MAKAMCHQCMHVRSIPGNTRVRCSKPYPQVKGNRHGIRNGWFLYPMNYDPVWMENECRNFEEKQKERG